MDQLRPFMADVLYNLHQNLLHLSLRERSQTSWSDLAQLDLATGRGEDSLQRLEVQLGPGLDREAHRRRRQLWETRQRRTMTPLRLAVALEFLRAYFAYPVGTFAVREAEECSRARGGPDTVTLPLVTPRHQADLFDSVHLGLGVMPT